MKKPHQHFIPRTYLRNFAHVQNGDKYLVSAFNKLTEKTVPTISIVDICVETDFYTLKHEEGDQKYVIENFFADNIESKYPEVYRLLVEEKKEIITEEERTYILYTILSMYFRTPKVLNQFVAFAAKLLEQTEQNSDVDSIEFLGYEISIKEKSFEEIKKEIRETHRLDYIKTQLALLNNFVRFKALDGFVLIELIGDQEFITSDNPIEIGNSLGEGFDLFDGRNSIYVPLDPKHALFIAPKKEEAIINMVFHHRDDFFQHVILNNSVYENAERWIIGTESGISKFQAAHIEYGQPATEDHPVIVKFEEKLELLHTMLLLAQKGVTNDNQELVDFMKNLKQHKLFNNSVDFQDKYNTLKDMGLDI